MVKKGIFWRKFGFQRVNWLWRVFNQSTGSSVFLYCALWELCSQSQIKHALQLWKNWFMLLAVHISCYGCTWEVCRALKELKVLSAAPQATLTFLWCSPWLDICTLTMNEFFTCINYLRLNNHFEYYYQLIINSQYT